MIFQLAWICFVIFGWAPRVVALAPTRPQRVGQPNILVITTDDQSWRTLGCYSAEGAWPWVRTPAIDRLAAEGVRFTQDYGGSWCVPSRASFLTGRQPHGVEGLRCSSFVDECYDPTVCRFWPAELRKAGYTTAFVGKWHLGEDTGHGRDWDHSVVWNTKDQKGDLHNDQILSIDAEAKRVVPGHSTDVYTRHADEFIRREHDRPWFLWLCYLAPHYPLAVAPRHRERYAGAEVPIPADVFGPRPGKPAYQQTFSHWKRGEDGMPTFYGHTLPEAVRGYNRLVCAVDEGVAQVRQALEATGQLDETLIVFTSDQGFAWGEHGYAQKIGPYEACMRMPLIVRGPGVGSRGTVCRQPVAVVDLAVTVLAGAGLEPPWAMHGHDLTPLLRDPSAPWPHPVLLEHFRWEFGRDTDRAQTNDALNHGVPWWLSLRYGRYKYIRTLDKDEGEELYDVEGDVREERNLALGPSNRELLEEYRGRLHAELNRTEAGIRPHLSVSGAAGANSALSPRRPDG
jgi:arylsulfatase A-like enzyme